MKIHEYQAKELLRNYGVPVLRGKAVYSAEEAGKVSFDEFESQGIPVVVLKAQIHAGGRGKGSICNPETNEEIAIDAKTVRGVNVLAGDMLADKVYRYANAMLGNKLVTIQTGAEGTIVRRLLIEEGCAIAKEYYASILLDRQTGQNVIMVSTEGGMDIEKVAEETPEKIIKVYIDPTIGFSPFHARELAFGLGLQGAQISEFAYFMTNLVKAYDDLDCNLLEINPLVLTKDEKMIALDAKMTFDDNAIYRHPDFPALRDIHEESPLEVEASKYDLNYIKLDGNVGCMVNGAGLAMATMDIIKLSGGSPANFLDVGGGANVTRIANAFRIMMSDENVKAVLINIFGGIVRCDKVAEGIIQALKTVDVNVPVIVRLDGTNAEEGKQALLNSGMEFKVAINLKDAAAAVTEVFGE